LKREVEETKTDLSNVKKVLDVKSVELKICNDTVKNLKHEVQKLGDELCDTQIELTEQFGIVKVKNKEIDKIRKLNKELKKRIIEQATAFDEQNNEAKEQLKTQKASFDDLVVFNKDLEKDLFKEETEETLSQTQSHPDLPYKHSSNRFEPLNQSEKDPNSLKHDPGLLDQQAQHVPHQLAQPCHHLHDRHGEPITGSPSTPIKATPAVVTLKQLR
jgi:chromosome segregation ATPase